MKAFDLSSISALPFSVELPVSNQTIKMRSLLAGEYKKLLFIKESPDEQITEFILDALENCTVTDINISALPVGDVEFMMLQLLSVSGTETAPLSYECQAIIETVTEPEPDTEAEPETTKRKCKTTIQSGYRLQDVDITEHEDYKQNTFKINDTVSLTLKPLTLEIMSGLDMNTEQGLFAAIERSVDYITAGDEVTKASEITNLVEVLDLLTSTVLSDLTKYIQATPRLKASIKLKCPSCGAEAVDVLEGIHDFF
jgi:hypothetical protein